MRLLEKGSTERPFYLTHVVWLVYASLGYVPSDLLDVKSLYVKDGVVPPDVDWATAQIHRQYMPNTTLVDFLDVQPDEQVKHLFDDKIIKAICARVDQECFDHKHGAYVFRFNRIVKLLTSGRIDASEINLLPLSKLPKDLLARFALRDLPIKMLEMYSGDKRVLDFLGLTSHNWFASKAQETAVREDIQFGGLGHKHLQEMDDSKAAIHPAIMLLHVVCSTKRAPSEESVAYLRTQLHKDVFDQLLLDIPALATAFTTSATDV